MEHSQYLIDALIFLTATVVVVPAFRRFRSSPIIGYLAAGIVIGPHGFALVGDTEATHTLAEFGVVFLLFMIGLELSIGRLRALGSKIFGLGSLQVGVTGIIIGTIVWTLDLGIEAAVIIGGGLALSSTAFVLQLLVERGDRATPFGMATFSILLLQDLAVVPLLVLVTLLGSDGASFLEVFGLAFVKGAAALIVVIGFGRFLLRPLYRIIAAARSPELFVATTLLMVLGTGWVMALAGLSMELGALLAGLLLAETEFRHQIEADIRPFRGILLGLFFITIGMSVNVDFILNNLVLIGLLVAAILIGKSIITAVMCLIVGMSTSNAVRVGLALSQGGEFGFVLFGAALALDLIPDNVAQILMAVIALSMALTPAMFYAGKKISSVLEKRTNPQQEISDADLEELDNLVLIAGFGRVGQTVAKVLVDAGFSYVALDLDHQRVSACRAHGMSVYYGDANQVQVLEAAGAARAKSAVITLDQYETASKTVASLRNNYPDLPIYVRARDPKHMQHLEKIGATAVVSEAAESSLQLGSIVLTSFDVSTDEITGIIQEYREDDYIRLEDIVGQNTD